MKNIDERIQIAQDLINRRHEIDEALMLLFGGGSPSARKAQKCSICGEPGHRASSCPQYGAADSAQEPTTAH